VEVKRKRRRRGSENNSRDELWRDTDEVPDWKKQLGLIIVGVQFIEKVGSAPSIKKEKRKLQKNDMKGFRSQKGHRKDCCEMDGYLGRKGEVENQEWWSSGNCSWEEVGGKTKIK